MLRNDLLQLSDTVHPSRYPRQGDVMSQPTHETMLETSWGHFVDGLRAFIRRRVPAQDAEDVAQEALLRIHKSAASLRDPQRVQSWVYSVARHAVADYYRTHRRVEISDSIELDAMPDPSAGIAEKLGTFEGDHSTHEEVLSWLRPTAEQLPAGYREALLMADFEGLTQREVAAALNLSLPGAKSRVQRARRMLAAELERCCSVELGPEGQVEDFRRNNCDC